MSTSISTVELPLEYLILLLAGLGVLWLLAVGLSARASRRAARDSEEKEKDWGIPAIDAQAGSASTFHDWDPRIKLVSLMFFIFCVASINRLPLAGLSLLAALLAVCFARVPFRRPLLRLRAMSVFLGMMLVVMPLTVPARSGDTLFVFDGLSFLQFNARGLLLASVIALKASAIAMLVEPLLGTAPFPTTVQALASLRVPPMVCQMILLAHRYIYVFQNEAARMKTGMGARGFRASTTLETVRTVGNFLGMLLVRSFERTQRVYDAMLSRGYSGNLPVRMEFVARKKDWGKGLLWTLGSLAILIADRLWKG
ncbi:MAG: cobalt ECF transporter T component CbiQ [Syntrophobacter sp.]